MPVSTSFMSITVKIFMPLSRLCTSDGEGISYRSRLVALLSGFGSIMGQVSKLIVHFVRKAPNFAH